MTSHTVNNAQLPYKPDNSNRKQTIVVFRDTKSTSTKLKNVNYICIFLKNCS